MTDREIQTHVRLTYFLGSLTLSAGLALASITGAFWMFSVIAGVCLALMGGTLFVIHKLGKDPSDEE